MLLDLDRLRDLHGTRSGGKICSDLVYTVLWKQRLNMLYANTQSRVLSENCSQDIEKFYLTFNPFT